MALGVKKVQTAVCLNSEDARQIKRTHRNVIFQSGEKTRPTNRPNFFLELEQLRQLMLWRSLFDLMTRKKTKNVSIKDRLAGQIVIESDIYGLAGMI